MRRMIQALTIGGVLLLLASFGLLSARAAPASGPATQPNRPTLTPAPPATPRPTLAPTTAPGATATPKPKPPSDSNHDSNAQPTATAEPTATAAPSPTAEAPSATATAAPSPTAAPPAKLPKTGGTGGADLLILVGAMLALAGASMWGAARMRAR